MNNEQISLLEENIKKIVLSLKKNLSTINTGRAHPGLLNHVKAESYGNLNPLSQVSSISAIDSSTLVIQVWDKSNLKSVEKALLSNDFNPLVDNSLIIRIKIPKLSEEERQKLVKISKKYSEESKIAIRNSRRQTLNSIKKGTSSKDDIYSCNDIIQNITDKYIQEVDSIMKKKQEDLLSRD